MGVLSGDKFKLGPYIVLPKHNKLVVDGNESKVEPKIMEVLCYLIANKGEVVSRDKIAETLWPDTVTGLEVVTRAIFELRKILKDDPKKPTYIETIARKGYCFIYDDSDFKENEYSKGEIKGDFERKSTKIVALTIVALMAVVFLIYQWLNSTTINISTLPLQTTFLTDIDVFADSPAISPDGKQVLFTKKQHFEEINNQLVLLNITSQKQRIINDGASFINSTWLKNAKHWYYAKCQQKVNCEIIKHNIISGEKISLYQVKHRILSLVVSKESQQFFISLIVDNGLQIRQVNLKEPNVDPIVIEPPGRSNSHMLLGHDQKTLYISTVAPSGIHHLYQYNIKNQKYQLISDQFSRLYGFSLKDDKALWVVGEWKGQKGLWSLDVINKKIQTVITSLPDHTPMLVTSQINMKSLIYKDFSRTINIESSGGIGIPKLTSANSSLVDMNAFYSPNSKILYFSSNRNGLYDIWKFQDGNVERVTNIRANMIERPILTKQEDTLAFVSRTRSSSEIIIFDIVNKTVKKKSIISNKIFLLSWSNDQKHIYFSSYEDGQYNIYKFNIITSEKEKILLNAGAIAQESKDGKYLYYGDMLNGQLMRKSNAGQVDIMFKLPASDISGIQPHRLKVINDSFYYIATQENKSVLKHYSFAEKTLLIDHALPDDSYVTDITEGEAVGVIYIHFSKRNSKLIQIY
jgi:DNA-binding winged helix-turn-helix (wHTH) protein/Tol biopolymer transport system component